MKKIGIISIKDSASVSHWEQPNLPRHILVVNDDNEVRQWSVDLL